jgi:hypothetical protein
MRKPDKVHQATFALHVGRSQVPILHVVPDAIQPGMWRIRFPDGALSDMVNLSRAKDAAVDIAEGIQARKKPHKWSLKPLQNFVWSASPISSNQSAYLGGPQTRAPRRAIKQAA